MKNKNNTNEPSGLLLINKHAGVTSHDIVNQIRKLYGTRRVGHTGTLDPMATGVLVVLIGRAAKAAEYLASDSKRYSATLQLGLTTDSEDTTGNILTRSDRIPSFEELTAVLPRFRGKIQQIPPMYSALKINGQKLVDLARRGETVERQAREIEIFDLVATQTNDPDKVILDIACSGGTYIRTLCADIGHALGCGGAMASLQRTEACGYSISDSYTIAQLEKYTQAEREDLLIPTEDLFKDLAAIALPAFYERLFRNGCEIYLNKINRSLPIGTRVRICDANHTFFALGEVREYENGPAIKSIKMFFTEA